MRVALAALGLAGCYDAQAPDGLYACDSDRDCVGDQVCRTTPERPAVRVCVSPDGEVVDASDAAETADAIDPPDGTDLIDAPVGDSVVALPDLNGDWRGWFPDSTLLYLRITQTGTTVDAHVAMGPNEFTEHHCPGTFDGHTFYCSYYFEDFGHVQWQVEGSFTYNADAEVLDGTWINDKFIEFENFAVTLGRAPPPR